MSGRSGRGNGRRGSRTKFESWGPAQAPDGNRNTQERIESSEGEREHFATRQRANDFTRLMRSLPDPDPVLRKMGKDISALQELLSDSHLESVWSVRCSSVAGGDWFCSPGADGAREKEAAEEFQRELALIDIGRVINEMMDAVAYGFSPLEIVWVPDGWRWAVGDIVGKPPQWFEYDQHNQLVFKAGVTSTEPLPENRFLVARHRPSYANPYGVKAFSKCFWPCTFKKNGFRWWTVFVEKYGGAFLYGTYPSNAGDKYKDELLNALERMVADAVAIIPEGAAVNIESIANKGSVADVHSGYIEAANKEMSKAVLGQTLTTDIGANGSYAAALTHNLVREDLARDDRKMVRSLFNRLAAVWCYYNYGAEVAAPRFEFVKDEDLQTNRAERDTKLYSIGWRPRKSYIEREYDISQDDFDLAAAEGSGAQGVARAGRFAKKPEKEPETQNKTGEPGADARASLAVKSDNALMDEFAASMLEAGQTNIDQIIETYADALGQVKDYDKAEAALYETIGKIKLDGLAHCVDETRFAAIGIGAQNA